MIYLDRNCLMMIRLNKIKLILGLIAVVIILALLFSVMSFAEKRIEEHTLDAEYDEDDDFDEEDEIELSNGELLIGGEAYAYNAAVRNYLVIGTDATGTDLDAESDYQGNMADVLLLVVLNRSDNSYAVLNIDRNTVMNVPMMNDDGSVNARSKMQICTAHWYGGNPKLSSENTVAAVSELLGGMDIDGYYELNMDSIETLNHSIGGVTVTINDDFSDVDESLVIGKEITLTDEQAYNYVHARMEVGDGSNEGRMRRQEEYIKAFLHKLVEESEDDPKLPNEIYTAMKEAAQTDMTGNDISRILNRIHRGKNLGIISFEGTHTTGYLINNDVSHQEFYIDEDSYFEVMDKLYQLERRGNGKDI